MGSQPKLKRTHNALILKRNVGIASDGGGDQGHDNVLRSQLFFLKQAGSWRSRGLRTRYREKSLISDRVGGYWPDPVETGPYDMDEVLPKGNDVPTYEVMEHVLVANLSYPQRTHYCYTCCNPGHFSSDCPLIPEE
jgi:hypothetical protein